MLAGAVCLSHSPLMDRNRADSSAENGWNEAVRKAAHFVANKRPNLCVVFYPDHLNGFLYNLMPSFCIGAGGISVGDFGTIPGSLDIPEELAASCAAHCLASGVDVAISYNMHVDHGGVQPIEMLSAYCDLPHFIPIFVNCVAPPRPTFERVRALGRAVGDWARARDERIMMIGSGGLSHDPPLPSIASATGAVGRRLREGGALSHADRLTRQHRVTNEGFVFSRGQSVLRALNPKWDRQVMGALAGGDLKGFDAMGDDGITAEGGSGAHELRCWAAALSAFGGDDGYMADETFYAPVNEWITGMGVLTAAPTADSRSHSKNAGV